MGWQPGSAFLGVGLAFFMWVSPMMGIIIPQWMLPLLLSLSILLILVWPVSAAIANLVIDKKKRLIIHIRVWSALGLITILGAYRLPLILTSGDSPILPTQEELTRGYGREAPWCGATIKGNLLHKYVDRFEVGLVCVLLDSQIDIAKNPLISISNLFEIRNGLMDIEMQYSDKIRKALDALYEVEYVRRFGKTPPGMPPAFPAAFALRYQMAARIILMPKGSETSRIQKLADVSVFGGMIPPIRGD